MVIRILLLVLVLLASSPAATVPLEVRNGDLLVRWTIGSDPVLVLVDTGSTHSILSQRLAKRLGIEGRRQAGRVTGHFGGAEGVVVYAGAVEAEGFATTWRSWLIMDLQPLQKADQPPIEAVIGMDCLRGSSAVIDLGALTLTSP